MNITKVVKYERQGLGSKIRVKRQKLSKDDFNYAVGTVGISKAHWYRIEREKTDVPQDTLIKMLKVLSMDLSLADEI